MSRGKWGRVHYICSCISGEGAWVRFAGGGEGIGGVQANRVVGVLLFCADVGIRAGGWAGLGVKWEGRGACTDKPGDVHPNGFFLIPSQSMDGRDLVGEGGV